MTRRKWEKLSETPGLIEARVTAQGGDSATVDIAYDSGLIQIRYVSSHDLDYREENGRRMIANRYISWSRNLAQSIAESLLQQHISG